MRFTITWIFPFVAGLMTYHFIFTHDQSIIQVVEHRPTRAPASIPPPSQQQQQQKPLPPKLAFKPQTAAPKPKQILSIDLTESSIAQMEDSWNDLPQQAEA
jgi:hypothetical protein